MVLWERTYSEMKFPKPVFVWLIALGSLLHSSCHKSRQMALTSQGVVLPVGSFDVPAANSQVKGQTLFGGWAAHQSGIGFVAIYVDGIFLTKATLGTDRPDVLKALPQFNSRMVAGWTASIDTSPWGAGPHVVTAKAVSNTNVDRDFTVAVIAVK